MNENTQQAAGPRPDSPDNEIVRHDAQMPQAAPAPTDPWLAWPRKRKWIAGLLSFFIPGTGHFYLGHMQKGLAIMLLIIMDIFAIVHFSINMSSIPLITLLALFLPIIYFYSLFDALQSTDKVNATRSIPWPSPGTTHTGWTDRSGAPPIGSPAASKNYLGWVLVGAGVLFFVFSTKPVWIHALMERSGTYLGGVILIAIGLILFLKSSRPK